MHPWHDVYIDEDQLEETFPVVIEVPMGISLRQIIEEVAGGSSTNLPLKAVQTGGPSGGVIPADKLDTVFKAFAQADASTTRRYGGTGLGLSVSYGIISKYGGTIDCVSTPANSCDKPHGTIFTVKLPIQKQEA